MNEFTFKPNKNIDGPGSMTNGRRAKQAEIACRTSSLVNPASPDKTEPHFVQDMLSDCFHLCDKNGWDVEEIIAMAKRRWEEER